MYKKKGYMPNTKEDVLRAVSSMRDDDWFIATASTRLCVSPFALGESCCWVGLLVSVVTFVLVDTVVCKLVITLIWLKHLLSWITMGWPPLPVDGCCVAWWCPSNTTTCFHRASI